MGLLPLEFTDCLTDSPYFRENLHAHEKELEKTSQQIKGLIKEVNNVISAAKNLSRCQKSLANNLINFSFDCIGTSLTDDEVVISNSLRKFGNLIELIEDERNKMLDTCYAQIIQPLEKFRKEHIGGVKEGRKKFEKHSLKFCQSQERYLNLSTKKQDTVLQEADATLEMEQRHFCQASLQYVCLLQQVQERKKFEFVEPLLSFMYGWLTFYHQGHDTHHDFKPYMLDLQFRIQKTRSNFDSTRDQTDSLMKRMLELRNANPVDLGIYNKMYTRQGYLYLMEKKAFGTTAWSKQYCMYKKDTNEVTLIPYNQITGKFSPTETFKLASCVRRISDSIDKRFCFDITSGDKPGVVHTLQALSEEDRKKWMDVMGGKEPEYTTPGKVTKSEERALDDVGFSFVAKCIEALEARGLEEQGLYRVVGVNSKVTKLISMGLDRRKADKLNLDDSLEWESKTITSALKTYLRSLPEPLMTFRHHFAFIAAAKQETRTQRINDVHSLVHRLPETNFDMLKLLIRHLLNVTSHCDKNLMTVSNVSVCFGPTLLRPEEETVAAIMDIKFCNVVVEIMIENFNQIFGTKPENPSPESEVAQAPQTQAKPQPPQGNIMTNSYPGPKPRHSAQYLQRTTNKSAPPPVTHAVIKSYYDGPLSASLHNVHQSAGFIAGQNIPMRVDSGVSLRSTTANAASESNLLTMSQSPPSNSPPLHHPPVNTLPLKKKNSIYGQTGKISTEDLLSHLEKGARVVEDSKRVRTLYACVGENDGELSFEPNQIITNVRGSLEPGWLEGTLNGKTGLVPENYVEFLP
ncbi:rho GTPase-activating protein 26 isoform X4 [Neocloeon triangulifer]|uniref:rho GTPase-activating protein 26 isoform X4 n=1 Tax=Neocloeon triangulifer TaxID=2078957 RepID=UPI00286EF7C0|nr:rho GTPase-activating protein 26 isoform X4 [Neocloeon triangulifer]